MPLPFSRRQTPIDAAAVIDVVRHLETQGALMQLATETYNTALSMASAATKKGDEFVTGTLSSAADSGRAARYFLPALEKKLAIADTMASEHQAFSVPERPRKALEACNRWSDFLEVFLARTKLQLTCWKDWVDNPALDLTERLAALDQAQARAAMTSINELNNLIEIAGIVGDPWLSINCAAFNNVRSRIGLPPLTETDFRAKFLQGLAGATPRYFE